MLHYVNSKCTSL